ncbi:MAG: cyclodeaminase [Spirochaeta sp.]|jgi:ectoine utilization protein EutC|nr:cyclodeaminase [Spirochaeta sp.]
MVRVVSESQLVEHIHLDADAVADVERGFAELDAGNATVPPIMMIPVPHLDAEVDIKSAYIKGLDYLAVKVASGFFKNPDRGLPSQSGQMLVIDAETGFLTAVLLDNGYLTQVRTGAAGAVAAKYLAPRNAQRAGVIGSGVQARFQMRALALVRDITEIRTFSLDSDEVRDTYVADMERELGIKVIKAGSVEEVVTESEVVVTTTPSRKPFLKAEWLHPGLHLTTMGSDAEGKQEVDAAVAGACDIVACDLKSQSFRLGELRSARAAGVITDASPVVELGSLVRGVHPGRTTDDQITMCDLTGVGVQDTMISIRAFAVAEEKSLGITIG